MAVLLRAVGIPARVVNGFQRGEWNEVGQFYAVRQRDAHSWVEVFFTGVGWVTFDPSPRAAFEEQTFGVSGWAGKYFDALRMRWNRYVIDYNVGDQAMLAMSLRRQSTLFRQGLGRTWDLWSFKVQLSLRRLWRRYGYALGVLAVLLAAGVFLLRKVPVLGGSKSAWIFHLRTRRVPVAFYERMLRLLARRGCPRPPTATAREFASALADRPSSTRPLWNSRPSMSGSASAASLSLRPTNGAPWSCSRRSPRLLADFSGPRISKKTRGRRRTGPFGRHRSSCRRP